ncbi:MAG TPA: cysteine hydrolase [bacterium]|nr:cysteine hydrolase [bacterium]
MKTCLLVVDLQRGFISPNTLKVVPRIKELLEKNLFDLTIFTKFANKENSPFRKILNWDKLKSSEDQELVREVQSFASKVINKTIYSGVNDELLMLLRENKIDMVFIAGIDTDCCVLKTAVDLFEHNIPPFVLVYYAISNGGTKSHKAAITVLERLIGINKLIKGKINKQLLEEKLGKIKSIV